MSSLAVKFVSPLREIKDWRPYTANVDIHIEIGDLIVKTVSSWRDWYSVLRFRKEVFLEEYGASTVLPFSVDLDRFDWKCDQLVVMNKVTSEILGCYRVLCSLFTHQFYSETEFYLDHIKRLPGVKVELGRACVHPNHRNGAVIQMLWRGIAAYIKSVQADYAFGCTSIKSTDPVVARKIELFLQEKQAVISWPYLSVLPDFKFKEKEYREQERFLLLEPHDREQVLKIFPPLLKFYLKLGAKFYANAGVDRKLNCLDYFTLFDFANLSPQMRARFMA